jgi:hypothetical protein
VKPHAVGGRGWHAVAASRRLGVQHRALPPRRQLELQRRRQGPTSAASAAALAHRGSYSSSSSSTSSSSTTSCSKPSTSNPAPSLSCEVLYAQHASHVRRGELLDARARLLGGERRVREGCGEVERRRREGGGGLAGKERREREGGGEKKHKNATRATHRTPPPPRRRRRRPRRPRAACAAARRRGRSRRRPTRWGPAPAAAAAAAAGKSRSFESEGQSGGREEKSRKRKAEERKQQLFTPLFPTLHTHFCSSALQRPAPPPPTTGPALERRTAAFVSPQQISQRIRTPRASLLTGTSRDYTAKDVLEDSKGNVEPTRPRPLAGKWRRFFVSGRLARQVLYMLR